jgi:hypothetical protein
MQRRTRQFPDMAADGVDELERAAGGEARDAEPSLVHGGIEVGLWDLIRDAQRNSQDAVHGALQGGDVGGAKGYGRADCIQGADTVGHHYAKGDGVGWRTTPRRIRCNLEAHRCRVVGSRRVHRALVSGARRSAGAYWEDAAQ